MSEKFTPIQKANAVLWFGVCGDPNVVQRKFKAVYGSSEHKIDAPSEDEIKDWYKNFKHTGFIDDHDAVVHEEMTGEVLPHLEHKSKVGQVISAVVRKLNNLFLDGPNIRSFHPYHMELINFEIADLNERKEFAKTQLDHFHKCSQVLQTMWFTGEAKFYTDGRVECTNLIYTDNKKLDEIENLPHKKVKKYTPSSAPYLTVWVAMNTEMIIGPYFFTGPYSSDNYILTLRKFFEELHQVTSQYEHPIFVHDDSKVHANVDAQNLLENEFPNHWIGTGSKYAKWPHHSSDLSPINFFLWGYIKSRVFKTPIEAQDLDEVKKRINNSFSNITPDLLEEAMEEYKTRLERVIKTNGHLVDATIYGEEIDYDALKVWGTYAWPYM